jgi:UPF0755 protein
VWKIITEIISKNNRMNDQENQVSLYSKFKQHFNSLSKKRKYTIFILTFILFWLIYSFFQIPPRDFPLGKVITVDSGESLQSVTDTLYNLKVIKSPLVFRTAVIIFGGEKTVMAGDYLLDKLSGPFDLAYRLVNGKFHLNTVKITIPEGWNSMQMGDYLEKNLVNFDKKFFVSLAKEKEGYLFPDTYFVSPAIKPEDLVNRMNNNFETKIKTLSGVATSTHKLKDIIIMASILEEEARTTESRQVIAGILWKRLSLGMPLQVDSTFSYINGKNTYELTLDDLKINSPYNTYVYKGLPPGPIGNPGIDAIYAAIYPKSTKYLYFLSSKSGGMYYATTFEEHKRNKELYLNK